MAIWDKIFGTEKKGNRAADGAARSRGTASESRSAPPEPVPARPEGVEKPGRRGYGSILLAPHTTEKARDSATRGAYIFRVAAAANKQSVADAVGAHYGVGVERVRMIVQPAKERRRGRQIGWKQGFKKAMVQLKKGQKIETL